MSDYTQNRVGEAHQLKIAYKKDNNIMNTLDTRAKLKKYQESKIREYYSRVFKNENQSLAKQGINIRSAIGSLSKTRKKIGFKVPIKKLTIKTITANINPD